MACPFRDCTVNAPSMERLLSHIHTDHNAVGWTMGTLVAALRRT